MSVSGTSALDVPDLAGVAGFGVCGYVNPGAGDTPFIGTLVEGGFIVTDLGGPAERTIAVQQACHGRGIYI